MRSLTDFFNQALNNPELAIETPVVVPEKVEGPAASSFDELSEHELELHLKNGVYGDFALTDAIRPSYDLKVVPTAGYRHEFYEDQETGSKVPVIMAAASREKLFEIFIDMLEPLGNVVDVVLESSHDRTQSPKDEPYREHIDMPVLKSVLYDYEDLLMNDGCSGIAILNPQQPSEIQFDEHKLLIIYGADLTPFEQILESHGLACKSDLRFITEAEHVHSSSDRFVKEFQSLQGELGIDSCFA